MRYGGKRRFYYILTLRYHQKSCDHRPSDPWWRIRWVIRSSMPARARSARTNGPPWVQIYGTTFASASSGTSPRMLPKSATPLQPSFLWGTCHSLPRTGQSHCAKSSPLYRTGYHQQSSPGCKHDVHPSALSLAIYQGLSRGARH